ncbi:unnamed protein product [Rotaria socialis]|uniref:Uncharacterized protein n=2 Tax=Rotaria socialis TaxID=392032 RepID=A0A821G795_9BILA|nr:unnamed protein product [Rotaria socialis]
MRTSTNQRMREHTNTPTKRQTGDQSYEQMTGRGSQRTDGRTKITHSVDGSPVNERNMDRQNPESTASSARQDITTNTIVSLNSRQTKRCMTQNYLLIWVDQNIDETTKDCRDILAQLHEVVNDLNVCTTPEGCIDLLSEMSEGKAFVIVSGYVGQQLVPEIHSMHVVDAIYIFCGNKARHEPWAKDWPKIRGVFTSIKPICESLKKVAHECDHDWIPMSVVPKQAMAGGATGLDQDNLDQLPPSYMYSVIFKDIILEIDDDDAKSLKTLEIYCREQNIPETEINELKRKYHQKSPIWWYTCEMFLYGMLNRGLRSLDMEAMSKLGFFIRSLHLQLQQLYQEQSANFQKPFTVYRGQGLSQQDFQNLIDSKGGLLSFNNFLSTSKQKEVAMNFIQDSPHESTDIVGVIFIMTIDPSKISTSITPFAMIDEHSALPQEQEILFTMHAVFRIGEIKQTVENSRLWEVQLTITDESDPQLAGLTDCIKQEVGGSTGWHRMGKLMLKVGHFDQAEELYNELLENASNDSDRAHIYHQLGWLKNDQGEYQQAVTFYEKSLAIERKTLPEDDASLAPTYSNIGAVYKNMGEYSKALEYYEKSLKIKEISLPPTHPDLAASYGNIGIVYDNMGEYSKALEFYEKSLKIKEISLPPNHPSLATSYNNMGGVYANMGEYSKALEYYEKDLKITLKSLPPTHPNLATSYSCIGEVYNDMGEYSKALEYYEKSLKIREKALPPTHPDLANCYSNLGSVFDRMGQYSKALEYYEKAFRIYQQALPSNHPHMVSSYSNIALAHKNIGQYTEALSKFEMALKVGCAILHTNHPELGTI